MIRIAAGICLLGTAALAAQKELPARTTFVELDVVVADNSQRLVRGLTQADFEIKEDGRPVTVTSFREVTAAGIRGRDDRRSVVLLLDDSGIRASGTTVVQNLARFFLRPARPLDDVAVVRLSHRNDEAAGDLRDALERIAGYQGGALPYFGRETVENALKAVASISQQIESIGHRRKNLVCIGARRVCDLYLEAPENAMVYTAWRDAISAAARSNVSVYVADPGGIEARMDLGGGLVDHTGGEAFVTNNFQRAVDRVWDEAGHYYLLGYTPTSGPRDVHTIDVKMKGAGLHARARESRGD